MTSTSASMVDWSGIEDGSAVADIVWLCREMKDDAEWKPLRRVDCKALNESPDKPVLIDGRRATADPAKGTICYHFHRRRPDLMLTSSKWFVKEDDRGDAKKPYLTPMDASDAAKCEELYQKAIYACASSTGDGIEAILGQAEVELDTTTTTTTREPASSSENPVEVEVVDQEGSEATIIPTTTTKPAAAKQKTWSIRIVKVDEKLVMRKCGTGWFGKSYDLQRGYGAYKVEGEEEEETLGPVKHLLFVVHGVGEAMLSREDVRIESFANQMARTRLALQKRQVDEWKRNCETAKQRKKPEPPPPTRIELIPIEWYDRLHSSSNEIMMSLQAVTLNSIPALRAIANDVVFDVLMYLTPAFCAEVLECVTEQIQDMYSLFQKCHPEFLPSGGQASLIGHSLGSVICWDLLSILKDKTKRQQQQDDNNLASSSSVTSLPRLDNNNRGHALEVGYQHYASEQDANKAINGSWGPSLPTPMTQCLPFVPAFTMFLGSPLGLFLTLRGAHAVFDEIRRMSNLQRNKEIADTPDGIVDVEIAYEILEESLVHPVSPFTLPSGSMHNIFHPSDPVAYRMEPLLLPQGTPLDLLPPPLYLTRVGGDVRFHVKARQLGDEIKKSFQKSGRALSMFASKVTEVMQQLDSTTNKLPKTIQQEGLTFPLAGSKTRLDYQLQPKVIDNEYLAAVTAHSSYFDSADVLDYIIDLAAPPPPATESAVEMSTTVSTTTIETKDVDKGNSGPIDVDSQDAQPVVEQEAMGNVPQSVTSTDETTSSAPSTAQEASESKKWSFWK